MDNLFRQDRNMSEAAFQEYLRVCQEMYLDMLADDTWLWPEDSQKSANLIESKDTNQ